LRRATFCPPRIDEFPMTVTGKIRKVEMRDVSTKRLGLGGD
jgi:fatty-acyl-CoA synthase